MNLQTPLVALTGIGPTFAQRLTNLGLITVSDLLYHFPFRYEDFSQVSTIDQLNTDAVVTLRGQLWSIANTYTKFRKVITKAVFNDGSGSIELVWFNQPWLTKSLAVSDYIQVAGKIQRYKNKVSITAPRWEKVIVDQTEQFSSKHTGRLVPVYAETFGVTSKWLRTKIAALLPRVVDELQDPLPIDIKGNMLDLKKAIEHIHYPDDYQQVRAAQERLGFDELFFIQLATIQKRQQWQQKPIIGKWKIDQQKLNNFITQLPFTLTEAQLRVVKETISDLEQTHPMNRLIQGDVGSGKTIVATIISYLAYLNNYQVLLMAPTEILAFQHFQTLQKLLNPLGIQVGVYTGSRKELADDILVGTHALLSDKLSLDRVGLVIIDEQQRFGVEQRAVLRSKGKAPHFLTMTATPIPRTVALTLYGDLDLSIIDQMPVGRKVVRTHFVPESKRSDAYTFIEKEVASGKQVYIVTPLIELSETNASAVANAKAAKVEFHRLSTKIFSHLKLGLLHGRLKSKEKEAVINAFKDRKIDILVSTSVVEVGVDVANATIMMIEGAERFGLAQLHQLRGRVGRGSEQSYAFLLAEEEAPEVIARLKNMETIHDGLKLAELDLKIRGSGDIFGARQSGRWELKIADLSNLALIEKSRTAAQQLLQQDPHLDKYTQIKAKLEAISGEASPD